MRRGAFSGVTFIVDRRHYMSLQIIQMRITFTPAKRDGTLAERGLDFADAGRVFAGPHAIIESAVEHGELRYITPGHLDGRFVMVIWTPRGDARHIISMRYGHAKEEKRYLHRLE